MANSTNDSCLPPLERYDLVEQSRGMECWKEMQHAPKDGDWVRHEDVMGAFAFIEGYLMEHQNMLAHMGVHKQVVDAVQWIRNEMLTALDRSQS